MIQKIKEALINGFHRLLENASPQPVRISESELREHHEYVRKHGFHLNEEDLTENPGEKTRANAKVKMPLLHEFAENGDMPAITAFINSMPVIDLRHTNAGGQTAADVARANGQIAVADFLSAAQKAIDENPGSRLVIKAVPTQAPKT